jgi:hypothetical protein
MAKDYESATVFVETHPGGKKLGYVVSSLTYRHDSMDEDDEYSDEEPEESDSHGEYDTKKAALAAGMRVAKGMLDNTESVTVLFDGSEHAVCGQKSCKIVRKTRRTRR